MATDEETAEWLAPQDFASRVATGFCRNGPTVGNQKLEKYRWDELDDVISTLTPSEPAGRESASKV